MTLDEYLTSIADALRAKKGSTEKIKAEDFAQEIRNLQFVASTIQFVSDGVVISSKVLVNGDPITKPTNPTKASTAQYEYTFLGWSLDGTTVVDVPSVMGKSDVTYTAVFEEKLRKYTIRFLNGGTVLQTSEVAYGEMPVYTGDAPISEEDATAEFIGWTPSLSIVVGDADYQAEFYIVKGLNECTWEEISEISASGEAANYFSVGDTKAVTLNGTVGMLALNNETYNVYILGFDHNKDLEGSGVTFGTFKTTGGIDVALIDANYDSGKTNGTKTFNVQHWGYNNYGGWAGCDMRYDILGSTDIQPSGYGANAASGRTGNNPSATCTSNPVANTLMAALPADLRAVLKPITKYTDNVAGDSANVEANVTATIDYLPLLAEYEIFGTRSSANQYEQNKQAQYAYFTAGKSQKYKHSATGSTCRWWERSPHYSKINYFCSVSGYDMASAVDANFPYGLAPIFLV